MTTTRLLVDTPAYRPFIRASGTHRQEAQADARRSRPQVSYLLHLLDGGAAEVAVGCDTPVTYRRRGAWLLPPGETVRIRPLAAGDMTWLHFTVDQNPLWGEVGPTFCFGLRRPGDRRLLQPAPETVWGVAPPRHLPAMSQDRIAVELPAVLADWSSSDRFRVWRAQERFGLLLRAVIDDVRQRRAPDSVLPTEARLARAEAVAAQSLALGFDVNRMARVAGYQRSYFSGLYRRRRGVTPRDFLAALRRREAERLLRDTDLPIAEVARQVGFAQPVVFIRMFRRHAGTTPGRWRRETRGR